MIHRMATAAMAPVAGKMHVSFKKIGQSVRLNMLHNEPDLPLNKSSTMLFSLTFRQSGRRG